MPIKWKSSSRFRPEMVLSKIDATRTVSPAGGATFTGFDLQELQPALHSMLQFPPAASEVDAASLVWRALTKVRGPLMPANFLATANAELTALLASREEEYRLLTTISIRRSDTPTLVSCLGAQVRFLSSDFPKRYKARDGLINEQQTGIPFAPSTYTKVLVSIRAKSQDVAFAKAVRALDLLRALWCLMGNSRMQITLGTPSLKPINVVRLGGHHTLHMPDGAAARSGIWFEPGYVEAPVFAFSKPAIAQKNLRLAMRRLRSSRYGERIIAALVQYVRAFDEADANTAFLRLWTAIESLTTPNVADYDKLVRRCAFLFQDTNFHKQMLEHLREYRNVNVHAGEYSDRARTLCFQLQLYFNALAWFHIRNSTFFQSLDEANSFLDCPPDKSAIKRQVLLAKRALKFLA
jgi:hypothetical protein